MVGDELAGANGGEDVRVAGVVGEGGLGVEEHRAHEHRESVRKLLGGSRARSPSGLAGPR